jgi:hypothetical protein
VLAVKVPLRVQPCGTLAVALAEVELLVVLAVAAIPAHLARMAWAAVAVEILPAEPKVAVAS